MSKSYLRFHKTEQFNEALNSLKSIPMDELDALDLLWLGKYYEFGICQTIDVKLAKNYYLKSIELKNDGEALFRLARTYMKLGKDDKYVQYLNKSSSEGFGAAYYWLGNYYAKGNRVNKNINLAMKHFLQGYSLGHYPSRTNYGFSLIKFESVLLKKIIGTYHLVVGSCQSLFTVMFKPNSESITIYGEVDNIHNPNV